MILPYLPDEDRTDLTKEGYKDVTAVWRPMDLTDKAKWVDACRKEGADVESAEAQAIGLRLQLLRIEGLEVEEVIKKEGQPDEKTTRPFDVAKDFRRIPLGILTPTWKDLYAKSALSEADAKN